MAGCTVEQLCQSSVLDFMSPERRAAAAANLERRRMGQGDQFDTTLHRPDGTVISISVSASPLFNGKGEFTGILSMVTDISERKRAEESSGAPGPARWPHRTAEPRLAPGPLRKRHPYRPS